MAQDSVSQQPKKPALLTYFFRREFELLFFPTFLGVVLIVRDLGARGAQLWGHSPLRYGTELAEPESAASGGRSCRWEVRLRIPGFLG